MGESFVDPSVPLWGHGEDNRALWHALDAACDFPEVPDDLSIDHGFFMDEIELQEAVSHQGSNFWGFISSAQPGAGAVGLDAPDSGVGHLVEDWLAESSEKRQDVPLGVCVKRLEDEAPWAGFGAKLGQDEDESVVWANSLPDISQEVTHNDHSFFDNFSIQCDSNGRKRTRMHSAALHSPDSYDSPNSESIVLNKDASSISGGDSSDVDDLGRGGEKTLNHLKTDFPKTSEPIQDDDVSKRQMRLIRNRESACQSRARKKSYVKDLELRCRMLESQCCHLQRAVSVSALENKVLKEELVSVKKPKDGYLKSGVAEPAVLESNSLLSEFLPHHSYPCPLGQWLTAGHCHGWLLTLLHVVLLMVVSGASAHHASLLQFHEDSTARSFGYSSQRITHQRHFSSTGVLGCWKISCYSLTRKKRRKFLSGYNRHSQRESCNVGFMKLGFPRRKLISTRWRCKRLRRSLPSFQML